MNLKRSKISEFVEIFQVLLKSNKINSASKDDTYALCIFPYVLLFLIQFSLE
jgi:hypothetical protein